MIRTTLAAAVLVGTIATSVMAQTTHVHPPTSGHAHTQAHAAVHDSLIALHGRAAHDSMMARHAMMHPDSLAAHHAAMMQILTNELPGNWTGKVSAPNHPDMALAMKFAFGTALSASMQFGGVDRASGTAAPSGNVHVMPGLLMWQQDMNQRDCLASIRINPNDLQKEHTLAGTLTCGSEKIPFTARKTPGSH